MPLNETCIGGRGCAGSAVAFFDPNNYLAAEISGPGLLSSLTGLVRHFSLERGRKVYELKNHLGNVLAVVSDRKIGFDYDPSFVGQSFSDGRADYYLADLLSAQDYYAFGGLMPGRTYSTPGYRYGYNAQEKDDEMQGTGNSLTYEYRVYDPRVCRFYSIDPLSGKYPWLTPYQFSSNSPIGLREIEGKEGEQATTSVLKNQGHNGPVIQIVTAKDASWTVKTPYSEEFLGTSQETEKYRATVSFDGFDIQLVFEVAIGFVPVVGDAYDALSLAYYVAVGDKENAAFAALALAIPFVSVAVFKGGKALVKWAKGAEAVVENADEVKGVVKTLDVEAPPKSMGDAAGGAEESGKIYKVPGEDTQSGKPYIGRTTQESPAKRGKGANDGRNREDAEIIDRYDPKKQGEGPFKEQKAIDNHGGIENLDNKRNEVSPNRMEKLRDTYENK